MTAPATAPKAGLAAIAVLVTCGALWGFTQPLFKLAVSAGHQGFGIVFWHMVVGLAVTATILWWRGHRLRWTRQALVLYLLIAVTGIALPPVFSVRAAEVLPAGIMLLVVSTVPLFTFPLSLALGADRASARRLAGLCLGVAGVALAALPGASLPHPAMLAALPIAFVTPLLYAIEGSVVGRWYADTLDPVETVCGAFLIGAVISLPAALAEGSAFLPGWDSGGVAVILGASINAGVYAGYLWLIGRAGAVFAGQVAYLIALFGIVWAMVLLGERYAPTVWVAFALLIGGVALVRPRAVITPRG